MHQTRRGDELAGWRRCGLAVLLLFVVTRTATADPEATTISSPATAANEDDPNNQNEEERVKNNLSRLLYLSSVNGGADEGGTPILAGWDKKNGFHIRDEGDNFRLRFIGRLQPRYTNKAMGQRGNQSGPSVRPGADTSAFELERARLGMAGHLLSRRLTYKVEIDSHTDSGGANLTDALIYFKEALGEGDQHLNLGVGQFKPRFIRQQKTSSAKQQFVDRSLMAEFFNLDRNIGIWADGTCGPLDWHAALTNGWDSGNASTTTIDHSPAVILGVDFNILRDSDRNMKFEEGDFRQTESPAWVVGTAFAMDHNNLSATAPGGQIDFGAYAFEIDTAFKWMGMSFQAEYAARWLESSALDERGITDATRGTSFLHGFYAQGGYFLVPSTLEVAVRGSFIWSEGGGCRQRKRRGTRPCRRLVPVQRPQGETASRRLVCGYPDDHAALVGDSRRFGAVAGDQQQFHGTCGRRFRRHDANSAADRLVIFPQT